MFFHNLLQSRDISLILGHWFVMFPCELHNCCRCFGGVRVYLIHFAFTSNFVFQFWQKFYGHLFLSPHFLLGRFLTRFGFWILNHNRFEIFEWIFAHIGPILTRCQYGLVKVNLSDSGSFFIRDSPDCTARLKVSFGSVTWVVPFDFTCDFTQHVPDLDCIGFCIGVPGGSYHWQTSIPTTKDSDLQLPLQKELILEVLIA